MPRGVYKRNDTGKVATMGNVHQAIVYLRAADRAIANKPVKNLTEAEVYGHLAYKALTEKQ